MFIWVVLPEHVDANAFLDTALEYGVAYIPGEFFYANEGPKNNDAHELHDRVGRKNCRRDSFAGKSFKKYLLM